MFARLCRKAHAFPAFVILALVHPLSQYMDQNHRADFLFASSVVQTFFCFDRVLVLGLSTCCLTEVLFILLGRDYLWEVFVDTLLTPGFRLLKKP